MTDWSKGAAWMRGEIVPIAEAKIHVTDWGLTRSDITYDVVPVKDGGFFRLPDYLDRFEASMRASRLDPGVDRGTLRAALHAIVAKAGLRDAYCSMTASRGVPLVHGDRDPRRCGNHLYAWAVPYVHVVKPEVLARGAKLWIAKTVRRIPADSVNPLAKNYHWGDLTAGLFEALDEGYDTVALLDHDGKVTEGPGFNVFCVADGKVITSDHGVLHGVTRKTVLDMCREIGVPVETRPLPLEEMMEAEEVFLSTSGGGVAPMTEVAGRIFGNGRPGPVSERLHALYWEWTTQPRWREEIDYAA